MWINSKTFMLIIEKLTALSHKVELLEGRIKQAERDAVQPSPEGKVENLSVKQYEELMNGIVDETTGRVKYTDGQD